LVLRILATLNLTHLGRFWSQPTGAAFRDGNFIRYGFLGAADITGVLKGGYRVEIEVKTGKASQQQNQKIFEKNMKMWGAIYLVVRSEQDALNSLQIEAKKKGVKID
jgi:hypothetical protein